MGEKKPARQLVLSQTRAKQLLISPFHLVHDKPGNMEMNYNYSYSYDDDDMDEEYAGPDSVPGYLLTDSVKNFIIFFHKQVLERNLQEIQRIYDEKFNKLTEEYFSKEPWPSADLVAP